MSNRLLYRHALTTPLCCDREARGRLAALIAHAGSRRRRAAGGGEDRDYWLAGCRIALTRARALRNVGLLALPE